ncbi:hypothetical protein HZB97_02585 [Candidatus Gottesmanbacteria bacterium]|nr:hypothetical protein [Candidatus Gottesmanbacteria bacterium]
MSKRLIFHLKKIAEVTAGEKEVKDKFIKRADGGNLTREEDSLTHFCVYFAAYGFTPLRWARFTPWVFCF